MKRGRLMENSTTINDNALKKQNILLFLENRTSDYENKIALAMKTQYGWKEFTYKGMGYMSRKLASYLINNIEVKKGDKVAILSESMPEYGSCIFASVLAGMTTIPLDVKLTIYELRSILKDCEPKVIFFSVNNCGLSLYEKISSYVGTIPSNDILSSNCFLLE